MMVVVVVSADWMVVDVVVVSVDWVVVAVA